ncbi:MAG: hypothetical protein H6867_07005 [Rhodospirillales bacterium]|nr:hypothetical protein [Rhodospirillales bacterium]MCB9995298.1 hypothetical protein [Rhodospirillales bacterium]
MSKDMHMSFYSLAKHQTFFIDDVIEDLSRKRDMITKSVKSDFEKAVQAIEEGKPIDIMRIAHRSIETIAERQNAILVLQALKEQGETEIRLNTGQELVHQILARVPDGMTRGMGFFKQTYQDKLKPKS